jgi:uncharacterized protein YkwD
MIRGGRILLASVAICSTATRVSLKGRIAAVVAAAAIVVVPSAQAADSSCWDYRPAERGFARRINSERADRNLGKLKLDPELSKAARVHTNEMIRIDDLYHTPNSTLFPRITNWAFLGESVAVGANVESLHEDFMLSEDHAYNILWEQYRHVGVGTRHAYGRLWVTIIFEAGPNPGTTLNMPRCS